MLEHSNLCLSYIFNVSESLIVSCNVVRIDSLLYFLDNEQFFVFMKLFLFDAH